MDEIIYVQTKRYVYFDNDGEILSISNQNKTEGSYIETDIDQVINLITGKEVLSNYVVMFDPVTKQNVIRHRFIEEELQFDINNQIYKVPTEKLARPDFTLQQDVKNKRWNFILDNLLQENLKKQTVRFSSKLNFSITSKNDPHNLYQYFTIDLETLTENYSIPFVSEIELDIGQISVYTTKRLETYYHEVIE
mgnify:CR=1 FL=1|jgi:hypothetical protein